MSLSGVLNMRHNRNLYRPCSAGCHPSLRLFAPQISRKITLRTWFFSSLLKVTLSYFQQLILYQLILPRRLAGCAGDPMGRGAGAVPPIITRAGISCLGIFRYIHFAGRILVRNQVAAAAFLFTFGSPLYAQRTYIIEHWPEDIDKLPCAAWKKDASGVWTQVATIVVSSKGITIRKNSLGLGPLESAMLDRKCGAGS
jgi:hypothetical protein